MAKAPTSKRIAFLLAGLLTLGAVGRADDVKTDLASLEEALKAEQYREVIAQFEKAHQGKTGAELTPREAAIAAEAYYMADRFEEAILWGKKALALDPKNESVARWVMYCFRHLNRQREALEFGLNWTRTCTTGGAIYKDITIGYTDIDDYDKALESAAEAVKRKPDDQRAKALYAYSLARTKGAVACTDYIAEVRKNETLEPYFFNQACRGLFNVNAYAETLDLAEETLELAPDDKTSAYYKAACLRHLGREQEAFAFLEAWVSTYKPDDDVMNEYGVQLYLKKNYEDAAKAFRAAIHWNEWYSTAVENYLVTLNELDRYGETIQYGTQWKRSHASGWTPKMDQQLGHAFSWMKEYPIAEIYYRRALANRIAYGPYVRDLVFVIKKQGRLPEARALGEAWLADNQQPEDMVKEISEMIAPETKPKEP